MLFSSFSSNLHFSQFFLSLTCLSLCVLQNPVSSSSIVPAGPSLHPINPLPSFLFSPLNFSTFRPLWFQDFFTSSLPSYPPSPPTTSSTLLSSLTSSAPPLCLLIYLQHFPLSLCKIHLPPPSIICILPLSLISSICDPSCHRSSPNPFLLLLSIHTSSILVPFQPFWFNLSHSPPPHPPVSLKFTNFADAPSLSCSTWIEGRVLCTLYS